MAHQFRKPTHAPYVNQEITPKKPPGWDPQYNKEYSYETWIKDLAHWGASTDVAETSKGSLVVLRLGGLAREFANDLSPETIRNGGNFEVGGVLMPLNGLSYLIWQLGDHFEHLLIEVEMAAMLQYQSFHRLNGEPIDECLTRFELYRKKARNKAQFSMGIQGNSHHLLHGLRIPTGQWHQLLDRTDGNLPRTEAEFKYLQTRIRRAGHLSETGGMAPQHMIKGEFYTGSQIYISRSAIH